MDEGSTFILRDALGVGWFEALRSISTFSWLLSFSAIMEVRLQYPGPPLCFSSQLTLSQPSVWKLLQKIKSSQCRAPRFPGLFLSSRIPDCSSASVEWPAEPEATTLLCPAIEELGCQAQGCHHEHIGLAQRPLQVRSRAGQPR